MDRHRPLEFSALSIGRISRRTALGRLGGGAAALVAAAGARRFAAAHEATTPPEWFDPGATNGMHGQVIVGENPVYLYHLPMFLFNRPENHPHHYQVIIEVTFDADGAGDYVADRQASGAPLYTFSPAEGFQMLDLLAASPSQSSPRSLTGDIVRGHFEKMAAPHPFGITPAVVHEGVTATVTRVVYAHEFQFRPASITQLEYVLFGAGAALFLAHRITQPPDFDQILPVRIDGHTFADEELQAGILVAVPGRSNAIGQRLRDGEQASGEARRPGTEVAVATDLRIEADQELYFEEGELRFPTDMKPTEEEIAAGFGFQ